MMLAGALEGGRPRTRSQTLFLLEDHRLQQFGHPGEVGDPPGEIRFGTEFEVGRPPGLLPASSMDFPLAINFGPMELPPGEMYAWRIVIDETEVDRVNFQTRKHP